MNEIIAMGQLSARSLTSALDSMIATDPAILVFESLFEEDRVIKSVSCCGAFVLASDRCFWTIGRSPSSPFLGNEGR